MTNSAFDDRLKLENDENIACSGVLLR